MYEAYQLPLFLAEEVGADYASTPATTEEIPPESTTEEHVLMIQGILPGFECFFESVLGETA